MLEAHDAMYQCKAQLKVLLLWLVSAVVDFKIVSQQHKPSSDISMVVAAQSAALACGNPRGCDMQAARQKKHTNSTDTM